MHNKFVLVILILFQQFMLSLVLGVDLFDLISHLFLVSFELSIIMLLDYAEGCEFLCLHEGAEFLALFGLASQFVLEVGDGCFEHGDD